VYLIGSFWGRRVGLAAAVVVALQPGYNGIYHHLSSDGLFAAAVAIWTLLFLVAAREPTTRKLVVLGGSVFVLVMIRPASIVFFGFIVLLPLVMREPLTARLRHATIALATGGTLVLGWSGYNKLRYDDFTISRLAPTNVPLFRLISMDHLVRPENGPASRTLAAALTSDLLQKEPYRSYGVSLDYFLKAGRTTMWSDLAPMSDRVWGWDSEYKVLRAASLEAIASYPLQYAKGVAGVTLGSLVKTHYPHVPGWPPVPRTIRCELTCAGKGFVVRNGRRLPAPYYPDETIPTSHSYWLESTPDNSITTDWTDIANPRLKFRTAEQQRAFDDLSSRLHVAMQRLPPREPVAVLGKVANRLTELLPRMWVWLVVGAAALLLRNISNRRFLLALPVIGLSVLVITSLGLPGHPEYRLPFDPLFILFGIGGLMATSTGRNHRGRWRLRPARAEKESPAA